MPRRPRICASGVTHSNTSNVTSKGNGRTHHESKDHSILADGAEDIRVITTIDSYSYDLESIDDAPATGSDTISHELQYEGFPDEPAYNAWAVNSNQTKTTTYATDTADEASEEDTAADEEIRGRTRKTSAKPRREKKSSSGVYSLSKGVAIPETTDLPARKVKTSTEIALASAKSKTGKKKARKHGSKSSTSIPKKSVIASSTDTIADTAETSSAIPSRREVMLARNVRNRRAAENRKQMMAMGGGLAAVLVIGYLVFSSMFGASTPETPAPTGVAPTGAPAATAPVGNSAPAAAGSAAPSRQPPRRVE